MAKRETVILVKNTLDRTLKISKLNVLWGFDNGSVKEIAPGESGKLHVYVPNGHAYGLEFEVTLQDIPPTGENPYGTVQIYVDIPYWTSRNVSKFDALGDLHICEYENVPDGRHDYVTTLKVLKR